MQKARHFLFFALVGFAFFHSASCMGPYQMSVLVVVDADCFGHILSWLDSHQLCKLFWCGDLILGRLLKTRPLDWSIQLGKTQKLSNLVTASNIRSLDVEMDDALSFWQEKEMLKLPTSIQHLHIRQKSDKYKFLFALSPNEEILTNLDITKAFPTILSFGIQLNQLKQFPQHFLNTFGNTMVNLNLFNNAIVFDDIRHLPRSLTCLTCFVATSDGDVDGDPQFPSNLSHITLGRHYSDEKHMSAAYLDCLLQNLPTFLGELQLLPRSNFGKTFEYRLVLSKYIHLQSLSVEWKGLKGVQYTLPLPIPPSATNVRYVLSQDLDTRKYPFDDNPCVNLKRLHVEGFHLKSKHYHRLPRNLEFLDWGCDNTVEPETLQFLPPKLQSFRQLSINGNSWCLKTKDIFLQNLPLFQSLRFIKVQSVTSTILSRLPPKLTALYIASSGEKGFGFDFDSNLPSLKNLCILSFSFDVKSLHNLSNTLHLQSLYITHVADISVFPFTAPCLNHLVSLQIWTKFSEKIKSDAPSLIALRDRLSLLKTLKLNSSPKEKCPTWLFVYLPTNLVNLNIERLSWDADFVADLDKLPKKLQELTILNLHPLSFQCSIDTSCINDSFLQKLKKLNMPQKQCCGFDVVRRDLTQSYCNLIKKLSSRKHLSVLPTCESLE